MAALHGMGNAGMGLPDALQQRLMQSFRQTADRMRNTAG